jgi:uncharacterized Zn-finger protein
VRVVLVLWLVSSGFALFLLSRIDWIVHSQLYDYGLQFSLDWAVSYWAFVRLVYVCLAVPLVLSVVVLVFGFVNRGDGEKFVPKSVETKPSGGRVQPLRENHMVISCPNCKRVFGKPLVMLDFSGGKTRLVNVCPYCNHVLGDADEKESDSDVGVVDLNKRVVH